MDKAKFKVLQSWWRAERQILLERIEILSAACGAAEEALESQVDNCSDPDAALLAYELREKALKQLEIATKPNQPD